ncbi:MULTISPECIES: class I SAM-dependent methyltransferase [Bacillus]|uniref:N-6 DNA methylase n=1 Tax=Bacillus TaxID=1386 RepID=UPI0007F0F629|nr:MULTISPECIES: class I SAM-dependent methyltransferase [Bacillus]ANN35256.1 DNA methyltransferase [Bacillus thuringiensis serovar coreanensis]MDA2008043.1 class I SAM-dependent methyltransferase [Bacillus cereus]MDA2621232.1 class I SAM-dependent methyltransferase [Bacillus cereus]TDT79670.1 adenine-specific DNA-methyltransferase [Bacillus sp. AG1163]
MKLRENASAEKLAGRYYTPYELAEFIVNWGTSDIEINNVLEPSCGDGVFLDALRTINRDFQCTAVEIFEDEATIAADRLILDERFNIVVSDFYDQYINNIRHERYQFIMGNPPYIRYQYLTEEQRNIQTEILQMSGLKPNKLINAWVAFVVATINLLDEDSKIGLVIPAELLQVKYAEQLRLYLMQELSEMTIVTFQELIFPDVEQEVVVLLGRKKNNHSGNHVMKILEFQNITDLIDTFPQKNEQQKFQTIDIQNVKWTKYFLDTAENEVITSIRTNQNFTRFGDIADVDVGITTGNNSFFCLDREIAERYDLLEISRPLIARSVNIPGVTFEEEDWIVNINNGARTYLLDFNQLNDEQITPKQWEYIRVGEKNGENTGYKCRIRQRWYVVPSIWEPNAFFLRRNYHYPKFVLNHCQAVSTDTMHRVSFRMGTDEKRAVLAYYNSVAFAFTELEARSYGGGVLEILPRELERVVIPNLVDLIIEEEVVDMLFGFLNDTIRRNENIEFALDIIDQTLLIERLGIDVEVVNTCRTIWHRLKDRRIGRGNNPET